MKLAIYDFDGTLFERETLPYIVKYYGSNKYSKVKLLTFYCRVITLTIKYKLKLDKSLDKEKYRATASKIFMYLFEDMKKEEIRDFFSACAHTTVAHFNQSVVQSISNRKAAGYHVVLCSGANTLLLDAVAKYLDVDSVIGTELHFLDNDYYDFDAEMIVITGRNKPIALKAHFKGEVIDWEASCAYGDSYYDFDFMSLTGDPTAVNPDDGLRQIAMERGWPVLGE